jgi:Na+-driven multidrug efflux pump
MLGTAASQAYGSGKLDRVGILTQRAAFVLLFGFIGVSAAAVEYRPRTCGLRSRTFDAEHVDMMCCLCTQAASLWLCAEPVLIAFKQPRRVAHLSGRFLRVYVLGLLPYNGFELLRRFLQTQRVVRPMMIVVGCCAAAQVPLTYVLTYSAGLGLVGVALSVAIVYTTMCASLLTYVLVRRPHNPGTWTGWSRRAISAHGLREYLRVCIPGR